MHFACSDSRIARVIARKRGAGESRGKSGADLLLDPVTTEVARPRWRALSKDKSTDAIRRRPCSFFPCQLSIFEGGDGKNVRTGEGIVCAARKSGITRSSDLHEWRNDLGTVSTGDSAKLQYE
jgi:hypothetical protein